MSVPSPTKFVPTASETRRVNFCRYFPNLWRHQLSRNIQSSKANAKFIASRDQNFGEYSHGHEHIIDHPRRDIFVRRVWLLWARALVLNGTPRSTQSAFISEGYPAMVKATVERMVKGNADALGKNGRAEKKIAKGNNDAVRLIVRLV
jgi:hypothetical protein